MRFIYFNILTKILSDLINFINLIIIITRENTENTVSRTFAIDELFDEHDNGNEVKIEDSD